MTIFNKKEMLYILIGACFFIFLWVLIHSNFLINTRLSLSDRLFKAVLGKMKTYTPDEAYKKSVKPLSLFFIFGAIIMFINLRSLPAHFWDGMPVPFFHSVFSKIIFMHCLDALLLIIGIGLLKKWKFAGYILFGYLAIGTLWVSAGVLFDYFPDLPSKFVVIPLVFFINGMIGLGLYAAIKPVFIINNDQ